MKIEIVPPKSNVSYVFAEPVYIIEVFPPLKQEFSLRATRTLCIQYEQVPTLVIVTYLPCPASLEQALNLADCEAKFVLCSVLSSERRRFTEAREFCRRSVFSDYLALIVAYRADYNSKTRDAVELILQLSGVEHAGDLVRCYPDDNGFFDVYSVIGRHSINFARKLTNISAIDFDCDYIDELNAAILYFSDILVYVDICALKVEIGLLKMLYSYSINKRFIKVEAIQHLLKGICRSLETQIPYFTVTFYLDLLLDLTQFSYVDFGFAFFYYYVLLRNIASSKELVSGVDIPQQISERLISRLQIKFVQHYVKIVANENLFQACINLTRAIAMTYTYTSNNNSAGFEYLTYLENLFWSENEFYEATITTPCGIPKNIQEVLHFNHYFLQDVHIALYFINEFLELLDGPSLYRAEDQINKMLITFLHNVIVRGYRFIRNKEEFAYGMSYSQIFIVCNEIVMFAAKYSIYALHEMLCFYFDTVIEFIEDYSLNEIILHQLQLAVDIMFFNIANTQIAYSIRCLLINKMLKFYERAIKWVKTELYPEYFALIDDFMRYFISDAGVAEILDMYAKEQVKYLTGKFCCEVLRFGVYMNSCIGSFAHHACKLELFEYFYQHFVLNSKSFDPYYVCEFCCYYLLSYICVKDSKDAECLYISLDILIYYAEIAFSQQSYAQLGRLSAGILIFALRSYPLNVFESVLEQLTENIIAKKPQPYYFATLVDGLLQCFGTTEQNSQINVIFAKLLRFYPVRSISDAQKTFAKRTSDLDQDSSASLITDLYYQSEAQKDLFAVPQHSIINHPERLKLSFLDFKKFPEFPPYTKVDELKKFVDLPGIPFTFVIPHYLAKIPELQTDIDTLIDDIGYLDQLPEDFQAKMTLQERPKSGRCLNSTQYKQNNAYRPCSAGHQDKGADEHISPIVSPRRRTEKQSNRSADHWSGSDDEEEDLLHYLDSLGDFE